MEKQAREWIQSARSIAVLTGAGVSAESGIPTFRDADGLWKQFRAEDLATPQAFAQDPRTVWEWYDWRRSLIAEARPNPAHLALARLEARSARFTLITQNVDGLHDRAGSRRILKIHGDIWRLRCSACSREWSDLRVRLPELPPRCACGAIARPAVVWFGEPLGAAWSEAESAVTGSDLLLVVGTSALVYPAAALGPLAMASGARVIEINSEETALSASASLTLRGRAGEILPRIVGD